MKRFLFLCTALLCTAACTSAPKFQPVISFVGIGTGTLATDVSDIQFQDRFDLTDHNLIAVVAFSTVSDGTQIQATWHSPDDRTPPLGRKIITTESGATVARFTLANSVDWTPAPFYLDIYATAGEGENALVATGSLHFYIGMTDAEISKYKTEYENWQKEEAEKRKVYEAEQKHGEEVLAKVRKVLNSEDAGIVTQYDLGSEGEQKYIIVDPVPEFPGGNPTSLLTVDAEKFAVADYNGSIILSAQKKGGDAVITTDTAHAHDPLTIDSTFNVQVSTGGTLVIKGADCTVSLQLKDGMFTEEARDCK